jgi:hypothetical protein
MEKIAYLLHEYRDIFPTSFLEMKGIGVELGEMKIALKPYANPLRWRPYRLKMKYKEKVKVEID